MFPVCRVGSVGMLKSYWQETSLLGRSHSKKKYVYTNLYRQSLNASEETGACVSGKAHARQKRKRIQLSNQKD